MLEGYRHSQRQGLGPDSLVQGLDAQGQGLDAQGQGLDFDAQGQGLRVLN